MTKHTELGPWIFLFLVAACDGPPAPTPAERAIASGAEAASTAIPELASAAGRAIEPAIRIDGWAENLEVIHWIVVSPDGWFAIPQPQGHAVRFFGEDGTPLGSLGREGEGPGEFQALTSAPMIYGERRSAGWMADTLWIWDGQLNRLALISPEREFVRHVSLPVLLGEAPPLPGFRTHSVRGAYGDGSVLMTGSGRGTPSGPDGGTNDRTALLRVSAEGRTQGHIGWLLPDPTEHGMRTRHSSVPLDDVSQDGRRIGLAFANAEGPRAGTFDLIVLDPEGDTVISRTYPFEPVPIPDDALAELRESVEARASRSPQGAARLRSTSIPTIYPPIKELMMGRDGSVWVRLRSEQGARPWMVLDAGGVVLDTIPFPSNVTLRVPGLDSFWTVVTDDYDVPSVVRYDVEEGLGG